MLGAGMMTILEKWSPVPPSWSVYLGVENCDAAIDKAVSLGGSLILPAADIPHIGRFALLSDPQGAHFFVLQFTGADA